MGDSQAASKSKSPESIKPSSGNRAALTPRVPVEDAWLVNMTGEDVACMTTNELVEALRAGKVVDHTFVWREGFNDWLRIIQIPGLKRLANGGVPRSNPYGVPRLQTPAINEAGEDFDAPTSITVVGADALRLLELKKRTEAESKGALAVYNKPSPTLEVKESVKSAWLAAPLNDEDVVSETQLERAPVGAGTVPYGQYIGFEPTLPAAVMPPPPTPRSPQRVSQPPQTPRSVPPAPKSVRPEPVIEAAAQPAAARESTDPMVVLQIERARSSFIRTTVGACLASAMLASGITVYFVRASREAETQAAAAKAVPVQVAEPRATVTPPPPQPTPEADPIVVTVPETTADTSEKPAKPKSDVKRARPKVVKPVAPMTAAPSAPATVEPGQDLGAANTPSAAALTTKPSASDASNPAPAATVTEPVKPVSRSSATQVPATPAPAAQVNSAETGTPPAAPL